MKAFKKILGLILAVALMLGAVACRSSSNIDSKKQQIYVYAVDNGMGYRWVEQFAEEFNAKEENQAYQVVPMHGSMDLTSTLNSQLAAGTSEVNIYFGCQSYISPMIQANRFIDISDVYNMKVDGESNGTIGEKMFNVDMFKKAYSAVDGTGVYAVPYSIGFGGLVYDYDYFLKMGFLNEADSSDIVAIQEQGGAVEQSGPQIKATAAFGNYEKGDVVLKPGKDGKYGTYDDGQVTTYAEYKALVNDMITNSVYPYVYTTKSVEAYTPVLTNAMFAQNLGYDNYLNFMSLNGDIKGKDGSVQTTLTPATGLNAYNATTTPAIKNAYVTATTFYNENVLGKLSANPSSVIHPISFNTTGALHTDAQSNFILGPLSNDVKDSAFLIEGVWWENEAKQTFDGAVALDSSYGYGKRDYRYYLLPTMDNQITDADTSVIACQDDGCGVLLNNVPSKLKNGITKEQFIAKCKEFLAYTLTNEALSYYTATTGNPRPFNYTLTAEQYNGLTKFQQNCWDLSHDTEHIQIVYPNVANNLSIVRSFGGLTMFDTDKSNKNGVVYTTPYGAFSSKSSALSVDEYVNGIYNNVNSVYASCFAKVGDYIK